MRIRTIKPEFFLHDRLFDSEKDEALPMRLAFIGLWCASDREGRFKWEPRRLGASILPYDGIDFSRVLDALTTRGFIERHASQGVEFGVIPSFLRHQLINNRESPSSLPVPTEESMVAGLPTREPRVTDACGTREVRAQGEGKEGKEGKGNGKGEEGESSHASGQASRLLLNDWTPDSGHSGICAQRNLSMEMQLERFRIQHGATLDTPDGWSRRFYGWIAQGRPEPIFSPAAAMVPPTLEQWTDHAYQFASTHQPFKREDPDYFWPGELARAKWNSHQAAGWARIVDWKAQLEADCETWNGYERANRKRPAR